MRACILIVLCVLGPDGPVAALPANGREAVERLPLIEVLPPGRAAAGSGAAPATPLVVMVSGDGGWAGLDREVSGMLAARGMPVVGFNSLRYFWKARDPDESARDLGRVMAYYLQRWSRGKVLLIGYSLGADVLPFMINRLPPSLRQRISAVVLVGLSQTAVFEVKISGWLPGGGRDGVPVAPELARLDPRRVLCLYGSREEDSLCRSLADSGIRAVEIGGGHHFGGNYGEVAGRILDWLDLIGITGAAASP